MCLEFVDAAAPPRTARVAGVRLRRRSVTVTLAMVPSSFVLVGLVRVQPWHPGTGLARLTPPRWIRLRRRSGAEVDASIAPATRRSIRIYDLRLQIDDFRCTTLVRRLSWY